MIGLWAGPPSRSSWPNPPIRTSLPSRTLTGSRSRPGLEADVHLGGQADDETPNASLATRGAPAPLVPLTKRASAWKSAPFVRNMAFLSPHQGLTCSVRDCSLEPKVASPL